MGDRTKATILDTFLAIGITSFLVFIILGIAAAISIAINVTLDPGIGWTMIGLLVTAVVGVGIHLKFW